MSFILHAISDDVETDKKCFIMLQIKNFFEKQASIATPVNNWFGLTS